MPMVNLHLLGFRNPLELLLTAVTLLIVAVRSDLY